MERMTENNTIIAPRYLRIMNIVVFVLLLTVGSIASLVMKKPTVSEMENRKLTEFPIYSDSTFRSGKYFKEIEKYYADNFPMRNQWINFANNFKSMLGFESSENQNL